MPETETEATASVVVNGSTTAHDSVATTQDSAPEQEEATLNLARVAWLATTLACLIAAIVALIDGYTGYAAVAFAVALSAAINLS